MKSINVNIDLIVKFLTGEATVEEKQELAIWAKENEANKKLYIQIKDIWEVTQAPADKRFESNKAWARFRDQLEEKLEENQRQKNRILWLNLLKVAAIVILTFSITWIGFNFSSKSDRLLAKSEINVPMGSKTQLILPDGSKVWVNSGSKLEYNSDFNDTSRIVRLTGEAYFDVVKNPEKPFIVKTGSLDIKAFGTIFNVKSYPDDNYLEALLVEGEVTVVKESTNIEIVKLIPNQKTIYYKEDAKIAFEKKVEKPEITPEMEKIVTINPKVNMVLVESKVENFTAWKDQKLIFSSETFNQIILKLERWYGVNIEVLDEKIKNERFTGKFTHNEPLVQVLEAIKITTHIDYRIKLNDVYISSGK